MRAHNQMCSNRLSLLLITLIACENEDIIVPPLKGRALSTGLFFSFKWGRGWQWRARWVCISLLTGRSGQNIGPCVNGIHPSGVEKTQIGGSYCIHSSPCSSDIVTGIVFFEWIALDIQSSIYLTSPDVFELCSTTDWTQTLVRSASFSKSIGLVIAIALPSP
jgi:hypothetical protein